jgi:hypothetical protein
MHGVDPLEWDDDLAAIAHAWANECVDNQAPTGLIDHNPDRADGYPTSVGENIYGSSGGLGGGPAVVQYWASEEQYYDYGANECDAGRQCGHYTQIVWATTTRVGCAVGSCPSLLYRNVVVCNYAPAGNNGNRPY